MSIGYDTIIKMESQSERSPNQEILSRKTTQTAACPFFVYNS